MLVSDHCQRLDARILLHSLFKFRGITRNFVPLIHKFSMSSRNFAISKVIHDYNDTIHEHYLKDGRVPEKQRNSDSSLFASVRVVSKECQSFKNIRQSVRGVELLGGFLDVLNRFKEKNEVPRCSKKAIIQENRKSKMMLFAQRIIIVYPSHNFGKLVEEIMMIHRLLALATLLGSAAAFDYSLVGGGDISLTDLETGIGGIITIFTDSLIGVAVDGLEWDETGSVDQSDDTLYWETLIDGEVQASGSVSLADVGRQLPTSIDAGSVKTSKKGRRSIEVRITVDSSTASTDTKVQAYAAGGKCYSFRSISENTIFLPLRFSFVFQSHSSHW